MAAAFEPKGSSGGFSLQTGQNGTTGRSAGQARAGQARTGQGGGLGQNGPGEEKPLTGPPAGLARLEEKLPGVLKKRAVAGGLCAVMVLASVFGIGGAKLFAYRANIAMSYVRGVEEYDHGIVYSLDAALEEAQGIVDLCAAQLGEENAQIIAAREAIALRRNRPGGTGPAEDYRASLALQSAITTLYNTMTFEYGTEEDIGLALQLRWMDFSAAQHILTRNSYNDAVDEYNRLAGSFPANLIGALWGAGELERFG